MPLKPRGGASISTRKKAAAEWTAIIARLGEINEHAAADARRDRADRLHTWNLLGRLLSRPDMPANDLATILRQTAEFCETDHPGRLRQLRDTYASQIAPAGFRFIVTELCAVAANQDALGSAELLIGLIGSADLHAAAEELAGKFGMTTFEEVQRWPQSRPAEPPTTGNKRRPMFDRDHTFLKWRETIGPAKIRDKWNANNPGEPVTIDVVKTGMKKAREESPRNGDS